MEVEKVTVMHAPGVTIVEAMLLTKVVMGDGEHWDDVVTERERSSRNGFRTEIARHSRRACPS